MKKLLTIFAVALLTVALCCGCKTVAFAQESTGNYQDSEIYNFVEEFLSNCPSRSGENEELAAAEYLKGKFEEILPSSQVEVVRFGQDESAGYNLIAKLPAQTKTSKTVVVGAHYDATGIGANDNACGVAALYFTMSRLASSSLPFNVEFVAFGGEERGLLGSEAYVQSLSATARQDVLVMFNVDVIVNGDNLYVFCENKQTSLANLILQNALDGCGLSEKPYAKGVYSEFDVYGYGYYEMIQGSDCTPFRLQNVPTVLFFSGNYPLWDYVESVDESKNNMNTNSDTLENLNANNGSLIVSRIQAVVSTICNTLSSESFLSVAENAREELIDNNLWFNSTWPILIVVACLIVLAVFAWLYHRKLEKISLMNPTEAKTTKVFGTPDAEDIFSFEDKTNDQIDDIFQIKK